MTEPTNNKSESPSRRYKLIEFTWVQPLEYSHSNVGAGVYQTYLPERDVMDNLLTPGEYHVLHTIAHKWHWNFSPTPAEMRRLMGYEQNGTMYRFLHRLRAKGLVDWMEPLDNARQTVNQRAIMAERTFHLTMRGQQVVGIYIGPVGLKPPKGKPEMEITSRVAYPRKFRRIARPSSIRRSRGNRSIWGYAQRRDRGAV